MENNENFVTEQVTENVEQTTEQTPKMYTQEQVDEIVGKRIARNTAKIRKEYDRKYGGLTEVLEAGTGKQSVEEITDTFRNFYQQKGIQLPQKPAYSDADIEVLARADAEEIIRGGFDEAVEEADRLASIGAAKMTAREKTQFKLLTEYIQKAERGHALSQIGVTEDVYNSKEFADFAGKFNPHTPIREVYDLYQKTQPRKEIKPMGSMKSSSPADNGVKEYYSPEEARKFTLKDLNENPALMAALETSMQKWK